MKTADIKVVKETGSSGRKITNLVPDRSNEELFELTLQMGGDLRVNPYSGIGMSLAPELCKLHDRIWEAIIESGDNTAKVVELKNEFFNRNEKAYLELLD